MTIRRWVIWLDDRLGGARFARRMLDKVFPDHWSFMLGEVALYAFVLLLLTGVYLTFFFVPDSRPVVYDGSYAPLQGVTMSKAYESTLDISFDVRAGLVMRQIHHWAALIFVAATLTHLARVFFTGAFRAPREVNWVIGVTLLALAMANGFTGYSLPDDLLSGTGLHISYAILLSIPFIGPDLAFLAFGGEFPAEAIISRLYVIHILLIPTAIGLLVAAHLAILVRQKHTQFPGPGRREDNVVGSRLWPRFAMKSSGLALLVFAVVAALGGLAQINPVWLYGPFDPAQVSSGSQPDWYIGWLEGALRLMPSWELEVLDRTVPNPFFPGVLLPGVMFLALYAWPFLERRFTGERGSHNLLDRPRDRPIRTALGVAAITFWVVLFLAGGSDVLADAFQLSLNAVTWLFRGLLVVLPPLMGWAAFRIASDLREAGLDGVETEVVRTPTGGYQPRS